MTQYHTDLGPEVALDGNEDQNSSAVAKIILANIDVSSKGQGSIQLENNESGGGETITIKVWESHEASPGAVAHAGATGWSQLGTDITLAPGDRKVYSWTTRASMIGVTDVATGAVTAKLCARVISAPPS
jgi:hypothetical protein